MSVPPAKIPAVPVPALTDALRAGAAPAVLIAPTVSRFSACVTPVTVNTTVPLKSMMSASAVPLELFPSSDRVVRSLTRNIPVTFPDVSRLKPSKVAANPPPSLLTHAPCSSLSVGLLVVASAVPPALYVVSASVWGRDGISMVPNQVHVN